MTPFAKVLSELDSAPEGKGNAFEKAIKWWLQNDSIWSGQFVSESIRLWSESPLRYGPDIGIDLTATDINGGHWAIQVKNWDPDTTLPKSEIDSFLSASSTGDFVGRLLVTTTNTLSPNARKTIEIQKVPCIVVTFAQLEESPTWEAFSHSDPKDFRNARIERQLLTHQLEAIRAVSEHFSLGNSKAQLIMACGSGKTLTGQRISESLGSEKTLILLPSLLLLQQTLVSWRQDRKSEFRFIAVCSDESVGKDEFSSSLVDLPFPVTTDVDSIANELSRPESLVVFATYQSSDKIALAMSKTDFRFDLVLADEAHRLAGISDGAYGTLLKPGKIPSSKYLFMTATPKVFGQRSKQAADEAGAVLWSMDDEDTFGREAYSYSFARAIREDRLSDYKVVVMGVSSAELQESIEERTLASFPGGSIDLLTLAAHIGLAKAMEKYEIRKVISFHSKVQNARDFASLHKDIRREFLPETIMNRPFFGTALSGEDPANKRKAVLQKLGNTPKGEFALVSNARCLTEGVDVPSLDGIAFIEPRSSQVDIVQAVGRAIRKAGKDKKTGYIIIPIFISPEDVASQKLDKSRFRPVWEVINALKAHDETLQIELDNLRRELGKTKSISAFPEKIILDIPVSVPASIEKHLEAYIVENTTESWEEMYGKAYAFGLTHGHLRVNRDLGDENAALGSWLAKQRSDARAGKLPLKRLRKLEELPGWSWQPLDEKWLETFEILRQYADEFGYAKPPATKDFSYKGRPLGKWVSKQRAFYKSGRLDAERIALLEGLSGWSWDPFNDEWMSNYEVAKEIAIKLGHTRFPDSEINPRTGKPLNRWVIEQRSKKPNLPEEKLELLESLPGWRWNPSVERFEVGMSMLRDFLEEHGHSRVPKDWPEKEDVNLHQFVNTARGMYRSGEMPESRIREFESLESWTWNLTENGWSQRYQEVLDFLKSSSRMPSRSSNDTHERKLASWVKHQKALFREGKLSPDKISKLEKLNYWQWESEDNWDEIYLDLYEYIESEGKNPQKGDRGRRSNLRLDGWYAAQKKNLDKLNPERQNKIKSLPNFTPFTQVSQAWPKKIVQIQEFLENYGHLPKLHSTDRNEASLGLWLTRQKSAFSSLSEEKKDALRSLPGFKIMPSSADVWEERFEELKVFVKANNGSLPTRKSDSSLAEWVYRQSAKFHKLSLEQQKKLKSIPDFERLMSTRSKD